MWAIFYSKLLVYQRVTQLCNPQVPHVPRFQGFGFDFVGSATSAPLPDPEIETQ